MNTSYYDGTTKTQHRTEEGLVIPEILKMHCNPFSAEEPAIEYGVNWAAFGTTSVEDTRKFAALLLQAADAAEAAACEENTK